MKLFTYILIFLICIYIVPHILTAIVQYNSNVPYNETPLVKGEYE